MDHLTEATVALLDDRGPAALSLDDVRKVLELRGDGVEIPRERLMAELSARGPSIHLVPHPRKRWAQAVGPRAWILVPRASIDPGGKPALLSRLRGTLSTLGMQLEPGSTRAWARWTRMLEEEVAVRRALRARGGIPSATP